MTKKTELSAKNPVKNGLKPLLSRLLGCLSLVGILIINGCGTQLLEPCSCSSPPLSDLNGTWELSRWHLPPENGQVRLRSIPHGDNGEPIKLTFDQTNQRLSGFAGCNRFTASVKDDPKGIVIGNIASTRMMCVEERINKIEYDFFYQLKDYRSLKKENNQLLLIGRDGDVLAFIRR